MKQQNFLQYKSLMGMALCLLAIWMNALSASESKPEQQANLQAIYAKAFGTKVKIPSQLDLALQIQKKEVTTIRAYSDNKKDITHVDADTFLASIELYLKPDYIQALREKAANKQRLSLSDLQADGIRLVFDQNSLSLSVSMPLDMRLPVELTIGRARKKTHYPSDNELATPADVSGYVNLSANLDYDYTKVSANQRLTAESVVNIKGVVLENQHAWRNDRSDEWTRNYTRLSVDRPEALQRITLGDVNTEYRNYQQGIHLGGIKLEKSLSLNPYVNRRSASQQRFHLDQDSEVKIYVNDLYKDKKTLDAGEYTLTDLNLESGANTIRLEITDDEGNITQQNFSLLNDRRLLQSGLSTYAIELGKPAYRVKNAYQYDSDTTILSGYYQKGFSEKLTAGTSFVTDGENLQVGGNVIVPTPMGGVTGKFSLVKEADDSMARAAGFYYQYSSSAANAKQSGLKLSLSGDYFDKKFTALSYSSSEDQLQSTNNNPRKTRASVSLGKSLGKRIHGSMNIQRQTFYDDDTTNYAASVNLRKSFKSGSSISTRLRYRGDRAQDKSMDVRLHVPLASDKGASRYKTLDSNYNSIDSSLISTFFVSPKNNTGRGSLAGAITHYSRQTSDSINANVSYRGNNAEVAVSHRVSQSKSGSQKYKQSSKLKLKTAVSFADGKFAVSKPIRSSFAMVTGPTNQDKIIAVAKGRSSFTHSQGSELPDYYQATINKMGMSAVINLPNYRYNAINVDSTALPNGSDPDQTEFEVKPTYRRGYLLKAGGELGVIVDGRLLDGSGNPLVLVGGQLTPTQNKANDKKRVIDFFTNSSGKFRLISVLPGDYLLELFGQGDAKPQRLHIPDKVGETYDAGEIKVNVASTPSKLRAR